MMSLSLLVDETSCVDSDYEMVVQIVCRNLICNDDSTWYRPLMFYVFIILLYIELLFDSSIIELLFCLIVSL